MVISDQDLAKLLIKGRYITPTQLKAARDAIALDPRRSLAEQLLDSGHLTLTELERISKAIDSRSGRLFGTIALRWHLIDNDQLQQALAMQGERLREGRRARIGEVLVGQGWIKPHQVLKVLEEQGKKVGICPRCDEPYNVRASDDPNAYLCPNCGQELQLLGEDAPRIDADGTVVRMAAVKPKLEPLPDGARLGDYKLGKQLGIDDAGITYMARRLTDGQLVAVKVLEHSGEGMDELKAKLQKVASLTHPHLRRVLSLGTSAGRTFVALEWVDGTSLFALLKGGRSVPPRKAVQIAAQLAEGLATLHAAGLIHGDVRPSNVLIGRDGRVLLANLGLSFDPVRNIDRIADKGGLAPFYVAPEQIAEHGEVDARADVYGLAATLYHLLTGRPPFEARSPEELLLRFADEQFLSPCHYNRSVPARVGEVVLRGLEANADERFASVVDFRKELLDPGRSGERTMRMSAMLADSPDLRKLGRMHARKQGMNATGWLLAGAAIIALAAVGLLVKGQLDASERSRQQQAMMEPLQRAFDAVGASADLDQIDGLIARLRSARTRSEVLSNEQVLRLDALISNLQQRRPGAIRQSIELAKAPIEREAAQGRFVSARVLLARALASDLAKPIKQGLEPLSEAIDAAALTAARAAISEARKLGERDLEAAILELRKIGPPRWAVDREGAQLAAAAKRELEAELARRGQDAKAAAAQASKAHVLETLEAARAESAALRLGPALKAVERGLADGKLLAADRPPLEAARAELQLQLDVLRALTAAGDLSKQGWTMRHEGQARTVASASLTRVTLLPDVHVTWQKVGASRLLELASAARPQALATEGADADRYDMGRGLLAARHGLDRDAVLLLANRDEPGVVSARDASVKRESARLTNALRLAAEADDPRQGMVALLAIERLERAPLELLPEVAARLKAAIRGQFERIGGRQQLHDFTQPGPTLSSDPAPRPVDRAVGRHLELPRGASASLAEGRVPLRVLVAATAGSQLQLRIGDTNLALEQTVDGTPRLIFTQGATRLQSTGAAPSALGGWRLLEVLHENRTLIVKLDGAPLGQPIPLALSPRGAIKLTGGRGSAAVALLAQPPR